MTIKNGCLSVIFLLFFTVSASAGEKCYIFIEKSGSQNSDILLSMAVTLMNKYVTPVEPIPDEGISSSRCALAVSIVENTEELFLSVKGKKYNFFGKSKQLNTDGITEALVKGIYQVSKNEEKKRSLCSEYQNILQGKCSGKESTVYRTQQEGYLPSPSISHQQKSSKSDQKKRDLYYIPDDTKKQRKMLKKGRNNLDSGDLKKARYWFRQAIQNNTNDGRAYFGLGVTFQRGRKPGSARQEFKRACEKGFKLACGKLNENPQVRRNRPSGGRDNPGPFYIPNDTKKQRKMLKKGRNNLQSGDLQRARYWFRQAIENNTDDGRAYFGLAVTFQKDKKPDRAGKLFRKACKKGFQRACGK